MRVIFVGSFVPIHFVSGDKNVLPFLGMPGWYSRLGVRLRL